MKKLLIILTVISIPLIIFLVLVLVRSSSYSCDLDRVLYLDKTVDGRTARTNLCVEVVNDQESRAQGLSGKEELGSDEGMLFSYDENVRVGFWMKEMNFSLDVIFIDENGKIVDIKNDLDPCENDTDCPVYTPEEEYMYAVEVNAGYADDNDINVGDLFKGL